MSLLKNFPALAEPAMRRYMLGQSASVLGYWIQGITLNLLLWEITHSALALGALNFLLFGPALVVSPLFGSRLAAHAARAATLRIIAGSLSMALLLLLMFELGRLSPAVLLAAAAVLGVLGAMEMPARQLLLTSSLKNRALIGNAVAMNTVVFNIGRMVGPAIAAACFAVFGPASGFALNALGLLLMLACVRHLPGPPPSDTPRRAAGIRAALAFARSDDFARRYLPTLACMGLLVGSYQTLIPVLAARQYGQVALYTGLFFSCAGAGSLCAALLLASRWSAAHGLLRWTPWLSTVALAGVAASAWPALTGLCFYVIGFTLTFSSTAVNATLQTRSPDPLRGGVQGLYSMAFIGSMPIGHLLVGSLSSALGPRWAFAVMSAALIACLGLVSRLIPPDFSQP